jgi:hypothetical protein
MIYVRRKTNNHKNHIAPDINSPALCGEIREWESMWQATDRWLHLIQNNLDYCQQCYKIAKLINSL